MAQEKELTKIARERREPLPGNLHNTTHIKECWVMAKRNGLFGGLFGKERTETKEDELNTSIRMEVDDSAPVKTHDDDEANSAVRDELLLDAARFPTLHGSMLLLWQEWAGKDAIAPKLTLANGIDDLRRLNMTEQELSKEHLRISVSMEQDAKKRYKEILRFKEQKKGSLDAQWNIYISRDRMAAWLMVFPPFGADGNYNAGDIGKTLQKAGVTTGIDSVAMLQFIQEKKFFSLTLLATGNRPIQGEDGKLIEKFPRQLNREVKIDENGNADYRELNYIQLIYKGDAICDIIPPRDGVPGVQVDGKIVEPKPVRPAKYRNGINTEISEDGLHVLAAKDGHLEFSNELFHVRPVLDIKGDVDYSTGNIDFNGDVHIVGDVREGFNVRATGNITIEGLVEAANVEAGGDLTISKGVLGDNQALIKSKGCIRVKYLENCVAYAGMGIYADCIMASQVFSDDSISVRSGRGTVIGGGLTATRSIYATVIGSQSGRKTALTLGVLPYVQQDLQNSEIKLKALHEERGELEKQLHYLEKNNGMEGGDPRMAKLRMRLSVVTMKEQQLRRHIDKTEPVAPDLGRCRFECGTIYPVTTLEIDQSTWVCSTAKKGVVVKYDVKNREIVEI